MEKSMKTQKSYETEHSEEHQYAPAPRQTFAQKAKRHCARFWWVHVVVFCISFLIISLCLVYVAMPKIAQSGVNRSSLTFNEIDFLSPTSDSVVLTQKVTLHSSSMYTPTLDPFNASLWLVTNGTFSAEPMLIIPLPKIHVLHPKGNISVENVPAPFVSLDQVTQYATEVISQENVTTALTGRTKLHEGKLPVVWVNYNTSTTYKGLNGLKGFNVTDVKLNLTAPAGTPNMLGTAYVPNPSVLTIMLGNVTLNLATAEAGSVGTATIENMTLVPGDNNLPMSAVLNTTAITKSLNSEGIATLLITGNSSIYNGEHLTYYEKALSGNVLTLDMNIERILSGSG